MSGMSELDKLIKESEEAIKRLDDVERARHNTPLLQRIQRHFHKNSPHLLNVLMAGTVLAVAAGRLSQKYMHEAEKEEWETERRHLQQAKDAVETKAAALQASTDVLVAALEDAAEGRGRRDVSALVRQELASWRARLDTPSGAAAAAAGRGGAAAPDSGDGDDGSGGAKIMI